MSLLIRMTRLEDLLFFGSLYYESISSPFHLWKMYSDTICRIAFNVSEKFLLPIFISSVKGNCRDVPVLRKIVLA